MNAGINITGGDSVLIEFLTPLSQLNAIPNLEGIIWIIVFICLIIITLIKIKDILDKRKEQGRKKNEVISRINE